MAKTDKKEAAKLSDFDKKLKKGMDWNPAEN